MTTRTPKNIEMQRGFKVGEARDFVTRTAAIGSVPDGANDPLLSAKELKGTWVYCASSPFPSCALMELKSGTWPPDEGPISQTQVEDVVEVEACMCPNSFRTKGEYGRDGNTK